MVELLVKEYGQKSLLYERFESHEFNRSGKEWEIIQMPDYYDEFDEDHEYRHEMMLSRRPHMQDVERHHRIMLDKTMSADEKRRQIKIMIRHQHREKTEKQERR